MVAVITAFLVSRVVFRQGPLFVSLLRLRGVDFRSDPVALALERTGVAAVMSRRFVVLDIGRSAQDLGQLLEDRPEWVVLADGRDIRAVLSADVVAPLISGAAEENGATIALPPVLPPFATVQLHATLGETLAGLDKAGADVALIAAAPMAQRHRLFGVISRHQIESSVRYRS
jgi:hypothetical protein